MRKDVALPAVVAAVVLLMTPVAARAGTYDVVACNAPGANGVNGSWTVEPYNSSGKAAPDAAAFQTSPAPDACGGPNGVNLHASLVKRTVKTDDGAGWTFQAPAGTTVKTVQIWRYTSSRVSQNDAATAPDESNSWVSIARAGAVAGGPTIIGTPSGPDYCSGTTATYPLYCHTGMPGFSPASLVTYTDIGEPIVSWGIQCAGAPAALCFTAGADAASNAGIDLQGARVTVDDPVAPDAGTDAGAAWRRGTDVVTAGGTDSSGIKSLKVLVDGAERTSATFECDYRLAAPCAIPARTTFDLAGVADGPHTIATIAEDAAGNVTKSAQTVNVDSTPPALDLLPLSGRTVRATVSDPASGVRGGLIEVRTGRTKPYVALKTTVRNGRMTATLPKRGTVGIRLSATDYAGNFAAQVATSMSLDVRVGTRTRKVRAGRANVPYGKAAALTGRLTTADGDVLAGQTLTVTSQLRRTGSVPAPFATAVTDGAGRFSIPVPAGPSRNLVISYAGTGSLLHRIRAASLRVPASATIHAADVLVTGAASVRFSGRLGALGASLPAGGKLVDLQAASHGHWTTVATTRATAAGWHAVARFRGNPGRYPVRLRIRREAVFPYDLGYSPSVTVRVR